MSRLLALVGVVAGCCLPVSALAQDLLAPAGAYGWFVRTHANVGLSTASGEFEVAPPGAIGEDQTSYEPQEFFGAGAGIGRGFTAFGVPFRAVVDGSLNFRHDTDVRADFPGGVFALYQDNLQVWDIRASLLADVLRFGWGRFYLGAGLGAAHVRNEVSIEDTPTEIVNEEWKLSPSAEAGMLFDGFFKRVTPEVRYRFRWVGDTESGTFPTGERLRYDSVHIHEFMFGFTVPLSPEAVAPSAALYDPAPAYDGSEGVWTGFHAGAFGGWAFTDNIDASGLETAGGVPYNTGAGFGFDGEGAFGGVDIGVDWQWNWLVLGLSGEAGYFSLEGSTVDPGSTGGDTTTSFETGWYGGVSARAGLAWNRWLAFGRIGVAFVNAESEVIDTCSAAPCGPLTVSASEEDILFGLTGGGGLEYAFAHNWSVGAEYRFLDVFDEIHPEGVAAGLGSVADGVDVGRVHTARASLSYRW